MKSVFKDRLIQAMEIRNVKAVELAEKTGLSKARISQYMNGIYVPKSKGTHLIAKALQVEETWLMGITDNMERTDHNFLLNQEGEIEKIVNAANKSEDVKTFFTTIADMEPTPEQLEVARNFMIAYISADNSNKDGD